MESFQSQSQVSNRPAWNAMTTSIVDERMQRLFTLDKMSRQLVFTDISKAQKYLAEQQEILTDYDQPDFKLSFHLNTALIENQLYNYNLSDIHFRMALEILGERGDVNQLAETYIDYAGTLLNLEQTDRSKFYLTQAARYLETYPDERLNVRLVCREGYYYLKFSNYSKALQAFLESERKMRSLQEPLEYKDYYFYTLIQSGIGTIYASNNDPEKSVQAYLEVVRLCEKKGMRSRLSWHYLNVGNGFMSVQDYDNASFYFKSAIKVVDDVNQQARALAYANLGYCYLSKGQNKEALELLSTAYPLFKEKRDKNLANIEWWRARIFEEAKAKKALKHFLKALDFAKKAQDYKMISGILKDVAALYAKEMDFKNAYDYQLLYDQAVEKYLFEQKDSELRELQLKFEAEWKEKEVEMFKLQASGLQLKALRAQMNPHFVFNALNSVQNFITSNDGTLAAKYLAQFAHLMRQSLEYSELEIISLEKEIEFLKNYLDINEKLRFENKLRYEIFVDEEIEEDILGVPTMIIQPYVENSIEHGIRPKKNGLIKINFTLKDDNTILCIIEDNGVGREQARLLQQNNPNFKNHRSLGTKITQDRLEILLKSKNREEKVVDIIDLVDITTGKPLGTRVEVLIPVMDIQIK
jgi:two-component system, LytTR family, sensor kinase